MDYLKKYVRVILIRRMEHFFESVLDDVVKVSPAHLHREYKAYIKDSLVNRYEGVCSCYGYIRPNSIELVKVHSAKVELQTFHGFVNFEVTFRAQICNPSIGSVMVADVVNMNSFGILCKSGYIDDNKTHNVVDIIVPRQVKDIMPDGVSLAGLQVGDRVNIEIIGKKYQLHHERISAIGHVVEKTASVRADILVDNTLASSTDPQAAEEDDDLSSVMSNDDDDALSSDGGESERSYDESKVDDEADVLKSNDQSDAEDY